MTNMEDVFGDEWWNLFAQAEHEKRITLREHREFPTLKIANYTPLTAYESAWDKVTLAARGLIFDERDGEILARPFAKFFNYGQKGAPEIDLDATLYGVGDKFDGSLGIAYVRPDGKLGVATRGSFHSEQADHANGILERWKRETPSYYLWHVDDISKGYTPLFEIIYPENRIVLDYEQQDYLQPLGWVKIDTGEYFGPSHREGFEGHASQITFRDVLERKPRRNAEGYVVWIDQLTAVKLKQEDYVALHAIVTNLSEKRVWEVAKTDSEIAWQEFVAALPDELQSWAEHIRDELMLKVYSEESRLYIEFEKVVDMAWDETYGGLDIPRKEFALTVQRVCAPEDRWAMFAINDGKSVIPKVFDKFKPVGVGSRPSGSLAAEEG